MIHELNSQCLYHESPRKATRFGIPPIVHFLSLMQDSSLDFKSDLQLKHFPNRTVSSFERGAVGEF